MKIKSNLLPLLVGGLCLFLLNLGLTPAAGQTSGATGVVDRTKAVVQDAQARAKQAATTATDAVKGAAESVQDAGATAADDFKGFWSRVNDSRLKNRTYDEILAWVLIGVMVGALAGMFTSFKPTGAGKIGRLLLGLTGAFLGGMIIRVFRIDFGWGPVLIRFEEVIFSLVGAVLVVVGVRFIRSKQK